MRAIISSLFAYEGLYQPDIFSGMQVQSNDFLNLKNFFIHIIISQLNVGPVMFETQKSGFRHNTQPIQRYITS